MSETMMRIELRNGDTEYSYGYMFPVGVFVKIEKIVGRFLPRIKVSHLSTNQE